MKAPESDPDINDLLQRGYRYALSLVHEPGRAEDLLQDACLRLSDRGGPWELGYLLRVIRNRSIDLSRRSAKIHFGPLDQGAEPLAAPVPAGPDDELARALGGLRRDEREAIYLSVVEGYSAVEIAALTERPQGTIHSLVHRAKEKLRRALGTTAKDAS